MASTQAKCPCCGAPVRQSHIAFNLGLRLLVRGERSIHLDPAEASVLDVLIRRRPGVASFDDLIAAIYGGGEEPDNPNATVKVQVSKLRKKVEGTDLTITNVYGQGYILRENGERLHADAA